MPTQDAVLEAKINTIIGSTVEGSSLRSFALFTRGAWCLGVGRLADAKEHAAALLADLRQGGFSCHFASIPVFVQLVLPYAREVHYFARSQPCNSVDHVALTSLQWLNLRHRAASVPANTVDASLYETTLSFRAMFDHPAWASAEMNQEPLHKDFATAQAVCIQLAEGVGRKAAGLVSTMSEKDARAHDSGYEEEDEEDD